jgi:hypothetical protein
MRNRIRGVLDDKSSSSFLDGEELSPKSSVQCYVGWRQIVLMKTHSNDSKGLRWRTAYK